MRLPQGEITSTKELCSWKIEHGAGERLPDTRQPPQQRFAVGQHDAGPAAQHLGLAGRQVELAAADIDPHIVDAGHDVRVARQAEPRHVKDRGDLLVRNAHIDVLEGDDVADILGATVESGLHRLFHLIPLGVCRSELGTRAASVAALPVVFPGARRRTGHHGGVWDPSDRSLHGERTTQRGQMANQSDFMRGWVSGWAAATGALTQSLDGCGTAAARPAATRPAAQNQDDLTAATVRLPPVLTAPPSPPG